MSDMAGRHFQGLGQGVRVLRGHLPNQLGKKLVNHVTAANYTRRISMPLCEPLLNDLSTALQQITEPEKGLLLAVREVRRNRFAGSSLGARGVGCDIPRRPKREQ